MAKQNKQESSNKEVHHPDDRFFRKIMSDVNNARAHVQTFYPEAAAIADLDTLEPVTDEFIRSNLKIFRADTIYRCKLKEADEHFYFSLIWEHKFDPEEEIAIQVGLYIFEFLYRLSKTKRRKIEPVLPLIFYNGKEDWYPKQLHELFENHPNFDFFKRFLPNFDFLFVNVTKEPIEKLLAIEWSFFRSAMLSMAFRHDVDLIFEYIPTIFDIDEKDDRLTLGTYVFAIVERSPQEIIDRYNNTNFESKPNFMSTLAMLREEGKIEGKIFTSLEVLLKVIINFPKLNAKQVALLANFKEIQITKFLSVLKRNKIKEINTFIQKDLLKGVQLDKAEQAKINKLIKMIIEKR